MKKGEKYQAGFFDEKIDRRTFMKAAAKYGLTVAMVAASSQNTPGRRNCWIIEEDGVSLVTDIEKALG